MVHTRHRSVRAGRPDLSHPRDYPRPGMDAPVNELPSVVVVVVTGDPGPELERTLSSVVAQDLPCSLLVIDDASAIDPTPRVAAVAPRAFVKRLSRVSGYAAAANQVIGMVEGAGFYLLCHDDIDLAPTALRAMVDEAIRSDAAIVTPKLVASDDHERLLAVGLATDRTARAVAMVERRELDQHQHDQVRDVAAASGACLLVGADLFAALRGFDESTTKPPGRAMVGEDSRHHLLGRALAAPELGEDIDLCWRARLRGARIVVAPGASVAHSERSHRMPPAPPGSVPDEQTRSRQLALNTASSARLLAARRNRVRTVSSVHGARRLVPALIGLLVQWLMMIRQSRGQFVRLVRVIPRAGVGSLLRHRRVVQRTRSVPDAQFDRLHLSVLHRWRRTNMSPLQGL